MELQVTKYERIWIDSINRGDVSGADEAFAENCVIHMAGAPNTNLSVEAFKEWVGGLLVAFPDLKLTVEDQRISGDKVTTRWAAVGTNTGPLDESPATGKPA